MIYHDPSHGWLLRWWHWLNPTFYPEEFQHFMGFHHVFRYLVKTTSFTTIFINFPCFHVFFDLFPSIFLMSNRSISWWWHLQVGDMSSLTQGRAGRRLATSRKPSEWLAGFECYLRISTVIYIYIKIIYK